MKTLKDDFLDSLDEEDGKILLKIALNSIKKQFNLNYQDIEIPEKLKKKSGAFVTINEGGELRGCIGYPFAVYPLYKAVENSAISAAFEDPRFRPLSENKIDSIDIEITVLGELQKIDYMDVDKIEIGKHGLYVKKDYKTGILLPQVAIEYSFSKMEFLQETCLKAGMEKNCYKYSEIYAFEGKVFK